SLWDEFKEAYTCSYALNPSSEAPACFTNRLLRRGAASSRNAIGHVTDHQL
ncbi:uncharacterized, partial [Tachysurus ichikawai]